MSTKVKVIEPNVYAGPGWRALPKSAAGDIIEVATDRYAKDLVDSGLVAYVVEAPAEETPKTKTAKGGDSEPNGDGLEALLDKWLVDKLVEAGLDTPAKVAAADDATLTGINGIGKKTLADIRAALQGG